MRSLCVDDAARDYARAAPIAVQVDRGDVELPHGRSRQDGRGERVKNPDVMTVGEINRELDRLDVKRSKNCAAFIATGRGHERPSDYATKDDPLSVESRTIGDRQCALRHEIERRYGPGAPSRLPLRKGFGPLKNNEST
jgi:hypothetical protein